MNLDEFFRELGGLVTASWTAFFRNQDGRRYVRFRPPPEHRALWKEYCPITALSQARGLRDLEAHRYREAAETFALDENATRVILAVSDDWDKSSAYSLAARERLEEVCGLRQFSSP